MLRDRIGQEVSVPEEVLSLPRGNERRSSIRDRYPAHQTFDGGYKGYRVTLLVSPDLASTPPRMREWAHTVSGEDFTLIAGVLVISPDPEVSILIPSPPRSMVMLVKAGRTLLLNF